MFLAPSRDGAGGSEATAVLEEDGVCAHPGSWAGRALQVHVLQASRPLLRGNHHDSPGPAARPPLWSHVTQTQPQRTCRSHL